MKTVVVLCTIVSLAAAAVIPEEAQAEILEYKSSNDGAGNYEYSYKTSNGIIRQEVGHLVNAGREDEHMIITGSYTYTNPEGKLVVVKYSADENGYQIAEPEKYPQITPIALPGSVVASLLG